MISKEKVSEILTILKKIEWTGNVGAYYDAIDGCSICGAEANPPSYDGAKNNIHESDCKLMEVIKYLEEQNV